MRLNNQLHLIKIHDIYFEILEIVDFLNQLNKLSFKETKLIILCMMSNLIIFLLFISFYSKIIIWNVKISWCAKSVDNLNILRHIINAILIINFWWISNIQNYDNEVKVTTFDYI